jgi:hypothetical protein
MCGLPEKHLESNVFLERKSFCKDFVRRMLFMTTVSPPLLAL